jgi:tetratricopeptide (TPR) repeat protein
MLILGLLLAYLPALHGKPIWDDQSHLTSPELRSWAGLGRIWFELGATQQYYPLTHTAFWLMARIWGSWYEGYHLINVLLHGASALLLVRILRRLEIRGAWLAAALWALHPVQVESVAWMSELKNCLSGLFYFWAALAYLWFQRERVLGAWFAAFGLFILGLLSKSVIDTLPAALLLVFYWKNGRLSWRWDVLPLVPFLAVGIGSGLLTSWVERTYIGASGRGFNLPLTDRFLIAGRAFWFYLGKLVWPANLIFIYPRWEISAGVWWQYLFPIAALGLMVLLAWGRKRWGMGPLVATLYFGGTLAPALGFVNIFPFRYSFVADHFQYLASAGPLALAAAGVTMLFDRWKEPGRLLLPTFCVGLLAEFGLLIWQQCGMYADVETLWRTTIQANPECWMAENNLGMSLSQNGQPWDAMPHFREALRINPDDGEAHNNLGLALAATGQPAAAVTEYRKALRINPNDAEAHDNLGSTLAGTGQPVVALAEYREALRIQPRFADPHLNIGNLYLKQGRTSEGITEIETALQIRPDFAEAHNSLGTGFSQAGRMQEAIGQFEAALQLNPSYAEALLNLGQTYELNGQLAKAREAFERVLQIDPNSAPARQGLARLPAGSGK